MSSKSVFVVDGVDYARVKRLGSGGAGQVWAVRSAADRQTYALKRIRKSSDKRNERFRKEIEFGRRAAHDNVVKIHAADEDDTYFYYTMELYPASFRDVIATETDYEVLLDYLAQLCEAVAYVHGDGAVHRDIKPENILVDPERHHLVLADFGIAHFKDSTLTERKELLANRNYQAPEQMVMHNAHGVAASADIFSLGLIITEAFTAQNPRGNEHRKVAHDYPFLDDVDLLVDRMMLQDADRRIGIDAARDSLLLIRRRVRAKLDEIVEDLSEADPSIERTEEVERILQQAAKDVLAASYIFERASSVEVGRYDGNFHSGIGYRVSRELYNVCVQSRLYAECKTKFMYEATGAWGPADMKAVTSPQKSVLVRDFDAILERFPIPENSFWSAMPRISAHYFRFCKDYHCEEILEKIGGMVDDPPDSSPDSLHDNLVNAPILWLASSVRRYISEGPIDPSPEVLSQVDLPRHVSVDWEWTLSTSTSFGVSAELFRKPYGAEVTSEALGVLTARWDASVAERADGSHSIHFRSREEFLRFRAEALTVAEGHYALEGYVLDLLRPSGDYDDIVELLWDDFDIRSTLAKVLGIQPIT